MNVTVIEDDLGICFSLRLALEDKGHVVTIYSDPTAVPFSDLHADVILVDYYMPKMDGVEVATKIRGHYADMRIILMSAAPSLKLKAAELRIDCIAKPFDINELNTLLTRTA